VLNEAGDIVSDIAVYAPFALVPGSHPLWVFAIIALAVVLELLSWRGARGGRARPNHGPMGKSDRALVFGVMALLIGCGVSTVAWINSLWLIVTALLVLTLYNRARYLASTSR
jgi:CDP-diacylglycerol--glycerol-3-phosphate 3-phosphatidyltransferase